MRQFALVILILAVACGALPGWAAAAKSAKIKFAKRSHDFGTVMRGEKVVEDFIFTNIGNGPLEVQGVHAGCGCTAVELEKNKVYAPGESGSIRVTLDTSDFEGKLLKTITVITNEKVTPDRLLTLTANIDSEISVEPPLVDFGDVTVGKEHSKRFRIESRPGFLFEVRDLKFNKKVLNVVHQKEGAGHLFDVTLRDNAQHGFLKETLIIANSSKSLSELHVPIRAVINGSIRFSPNYLEFGAIMPKESVKRTIVVTAPSEFQIKATRTEIHINGEPIAQASQFVKVEELKRESHDQNVNIQLSNQGSQSGSVHGKLIIETSDAAQKELQVDFYAFFR